MLAVQDLTEAVRSLNAEDLAAFRTWFAEFDQDGWDHQIEADIEAGRLDALAEDALREHLAGGTTEL